MSVTMNRRTILVGLANLLALFIVVGVVSQGYNADGGRKMMSTTEEVAPIDQVALPVESAVKLDSVKVSALNKRELRKGMKKMSKSGTMMSKKSSLADLDCVPIGGDTRRELKGKKKSDSKKKSSSTPAPVRIATLQLC